jgi:hypothetical protein
VAHARSERTRSRAFSNRGTFDLGMPRLVLLALVVACRHPAMPDPKTSPALPSLITTYRQTTGGDAWDHVQAIESHATAAIGGMTGTCERLEDVMTGRNRTMLAVGPLVQGDGWDGTTAWELSPGGETLVLDAPSSVALARTDAWLTRRGYFHAGSASYKELGSKDGLRGIEATPEGGAPATLWFRGDGLLERLVQQRGVDTFTTTLADYRAVGGVRIPFRITIDQGDPRNTLELTYTDTRLVTAPDSARFAPPKLDASRLVFTAGVHQTQVPFELLNNHIYIHAEVDGQPVRMMVDTGGANLLTPAAAKRLGISAHGTMAIAGTGADKVDLGFGRAKTIRVGDVSLTDPLFYIVDFGRIGEIEGEEFDGLVGFELFSRARVRIDYPARTLLLTAVDAFTPPRGAIAVPFTAKDRTPLVEGALDGIPARFWVDTGSRASLTMTASFTRDHELVAKYEPRFEAITGWGVGGPTRGSPVRFHEVAIGKTSVRDVVGDLFTGDKGVFADPDIAGNLGGGILRQFVVTFDYDAKIMYLEPDPQRPSREAYDRSGLFLGEDGDALAVIDVVRSSAADRAGVRATDRITAIDGVPVRSKRLAAWRERLRGLPGTKVLLHVEHRGDITVMLDELVP